MLSNIGAEWGGRACEVVLKVKWIVPGKQLESVAAVRAVSYPPSQANTHPLRLAPPT